MAGKTVQVQFIGIDDLDIDKENLRGSVWEMDEKDEDLLESVKKEGIIEPIIIRPAGPKDTVAYTIISGGRRYNAAIEAGLTTVPCLVRDVDDLTAAGLSVMENRDRKDIPAWRIAFKVIEWYRKVNGAATKPEKVEILATKFGATPSTITEYTQLDVLPAALQEMVKDPSQWSETTRQLVEDIAGEEFREVPAKGLSIEKGAMIARTLYTEGQAIIPEKSMMELGVRSIWETRETVRDVLNRVRAYPKEPISDLFALASEKERTVSKMVGVRVTFTWSFIENLDQAAKKRQMTREELVGFYVREGLGRDGFL